MLTGYRRRSQAFVVAWVLCSLWSLPLSAATITIINMDAPSEGLNDPTPAIPVGG